MANLADCFLVAMCDGPRMPWLEAAGTMSRAIFVIGRTIRTFSSALLSFSFPFRPQRFEALERPK